MPHWQMHVPVRAASRLMACPCSLPEVQAEMVPAYDMKLGAQPPFCMLSGRVCSGWVCQHSPRQCKVLLAHATRRDRDPIT